MKKLKWLKTVKKLSKPDGNGQKKTKNIGPPVFFYKKRQ